MKITRKGAVQALFPFVVCFAACVSAGAATTISVDSVVQRWPWNNKVDITYTVSGGQDVAAGRYCRIVFTTVIDGQTVTIDGVKDIGAPADDGTHTVTWTLPDGVLSTNCTMSAAVYSADVPSGDDYLIVDLTRTDGNIVYEGLFATQDASNTRYNADVYKTDRLVLRKVPAGGPYPTGDSVRYNTANAATTWRTARDYYIGVFPVTQYQYEKICGSNPASCKTEIEGNVTAHRPVENVSWNDLRLATTAPTSSIPAVASNTGTFLQRLNYMTGNAFGFDLPTEVMFELAQRAGATTRYSWGSEVSADYVVCQENAGGSTVAVGSRLPNAWGLYDTAGNVWEWCLDDGSGFPTNLADAPDPFTPACSGHAHRRNRGGGRYTHEIGNDAFNTSLRNSNEPTFKFAMGFRVAWIAD